MDEQTEQERNLFISWGLLRPTDEQIMEQSELLHVGQADSGMLVWVRFPRKDQPPITAHPPPPRPADQPDNYVGWMSVRLEAEETVHERRAAVGLPPQPFLYTLDQIAQTLGRNKATVSNYLHFHGVSPGKCPESKMSASNLADVGQPADWRVADAEFIRWLRYKGFKVYDAWSLSA